MKIERAFCGTYHNTFRLYDDNANLIGYKQICIYGVDVGKVKYYGMSGHYHTQREWARIWKEVENGGSTANLSR